MNKQEINEEDLLRKFLNPEKIEKAPEGFTSKTLTRIRIEAQSEKADKGFFATNRVPVISAAITTGLIITAVLISVGETESVGSTIWKYFRDIEFSLPSLSLPTWASYSMIGLLVMGFFDRALFGIFHNDKIPKSPKGDIKIV